MSALPCSLAIVIPALDAAACLPATLAALRAEANGAAIILVDGASGDATRALAEAGGARVWLAGRGRGRQLAAGVGAARAEFLLLLHADTMLAPGWSEEVARFMTAPEAHARAGYFRFTLDSEARAARWLAGLVAWRARVLGLPYGDQGLLVAAEFLAERGGVPLLPLMEDVALSRRIGRARLVAFETRAITSAVRWRRDGWLRRSARNLLCLGLYHLGLPPWLIARLYG